MNKVSEWLASSSRPLILLGAGARESINEIMEFASRWRIPVQTTWNAVDLVPFAHPLFCGRPGIVATRGSNWTIQACDFLLAIGARLDQPTIAYDYDNFAPHAKKVMVDVDISESLKIPNLDEFVHMDAGAFIRELNIKPYKVSSNEWIDQCTEWKKTRLEGNTTTFQLMDDLSDNLPEDAIIVMGCSNMAVNIFCAGFRNKAGQRFIMSSCGLGSMGSAVPVSIGVAFASGKRVTVIEGDGSIMQNVQELEVISRLNLPITIYVIDNGGYASIRNSEFRAFARTAGSETVPDLWQLATAFRVPLKIISAERDELPIPRVMFDGRGNLGDMYPYE